MKVSLVFPPHTLKERFAPDTCSRQGIAKIGQILPPLGLAYIAAFLEQHKIPIEIIDAPALNMNLKGLSRVIARKDPDIVGISTLSFSKSRSLDVARMVKETRPDTIVVLGGPHPTLFPNEILKESSDVDIVAIGEGEYTMLELVQVLEENGDLRDVRSIAFKENNKIMKTERRPLIKDLDELPFPARHLLPIDRYRFSPNSYKRLPCVTMITSRGCPYNCTFCSKAVFGSKYRVRSPENVLEEMKFVVERYGAKEISFWDDIFGLRRLWLSKFCDLLIKEKMDVIWSCETRVDLVDPEMLRKMDEAGCWNIFYGIESGCQDLLDIIRKGITIEQIKNAVKWTKEAGIEIKANFMLALPGETPEKAMESVELAIELEPDYVKFNVTTPYPGTELHEQAKKYGALKRNFDKYTTFFPVFVPYGYKSEEKILEMERRAYKKFYFRPSYIIKRLTKIRSPRDLYRHIQGFLSLL